ncbi:hemocyte protein-glutamine gamma-glutamyltransferase-like [Hetaerina americana]|uniref:hemocyte protein-glutamine gamma-glutamyltransferase-like n=1 Tax=Hetaerina americana TaxID=62018 RepID=UPI003A7F1D8D
MASGSALLVEWVHYNPWENAEAHHTDRFELVHLEPPKAILRRGQAFAFKVRFVGRKYDPEKDAIRLVFNFGTNPHTVKGTQGVADVDPTLESFLDPKPEKWEARLKEDEGDAVTLEIRSPCDAPVGLWSFQVETKIKGSYGRTRLFKHPEKFYLLFNPWMQGDLVYMCEERLLHEYVLNDIGKIWVGPYGSSRGRQWVFGQFDDCVLPACMLMLERTNVSPANRGNPIKLVRAISKIVNSNDDLGVLMGRWDGEYGDGTAPSAWTGSVPILEQYLRTKKEVLYGQCWVFSGVVTTVCRALGIPSRVVSNLVSAHDANASLTVDKYYNAAMEEIEDDPNNPMGEDSIWNYHVWNDVWMARPDLPKGYGGWQAIDATPQETSDGFYQCGPASLEAVKAGAVSYNYDVPFVLAEVNADLIRWKENPATELGYEKIECHKYHIGRVVLTKAPWIFDPNGEMDKEDVTDQYKAKEGTEAERLSLMNAVRGTDRAKRFYALPSTAKEDVTFDLEELDRVPLGDDFSVTVVIENKADEPRNVQALLSAGSVFYTGVKAHCVKKASGKFVIKPNSKEVLRLKVTPDEYLEKLVEYCIMKIYAIATVEETRQTWAEEDDFQVLKPIIDIKAPSEGIVKKPMTMTFSFKNPLKKKLTNSKFNFDGPGLTKTRSIEHRDIGPLETVELEQTFVPSKSGSLKLVCTFASKQLIDVVGAATLECLDEDDV